MIRNLQSAFSRVRARSPHVSGLAILCQVTLGLCVTGYAQSGPGLYAPQVQPTHLNQMQPRRDQLRLVQNATSDDTKPLPSEIESMPPVEEEMEVIDNRSQLVIARNPITRMSIADPSVIDIVQYSPTEISVIGLRIGTTNLDIWFKDQDRPLRYLVKVIRDPSLEDQRRIDYGKLERKLALLFPNSKVYLVPLSFKIIVKGQARDNEEAAQILNIIRGEVIGADGNTIGPQGFANGGPNRRNGIGNNFNNGFNSSFIVNMLEVPGEKQIMLRTRIAELKRQQLRTMGVDLNYLINGGRHALSSTLGGAGGTLTGVFEAGEIDVLVNWLAGNGTAKILSEPTLTVLSGHEASFLAGGEFPVPTIVGINGAAGQTVQFRGFGTSLFVVPRVVDRDLVRMDISPEFSQIDGASGNGGVSGLNTRRVETTVQLREGQTIVLAGLFSRQQSTEVNRIPYLDTIPKIGATLFSSKRASEDETELLITVSPEIVRPMDADEVPPAPGFYVTHPDDHQLYFYGMTEGQPDRSVNQLAPLGRGTGAGIEVGYRVHNPAPASPGYSPQPTGAFSSHIPATPYPMMQPTPMLQPTPASPIIEQPYTMPGGRYDGMTVPSYPQPQPTPAWQPGLQGNPVPAPGVTPNPQPAPHLNAPPTSVPRTGRPGQAPSASTGRPGLGQRMTNMWRGGNAPQPQQGQIAPTGYQQPSLPYQPSQNPNYRR